MSVRLSIIIPHYNDSANLVKCLEMLASQTTSDSDYEIIVADNKSSCGIEEVVRLCEGRARVVSAALQGAGLARNAGAEVAQGDIIAFIDSDCRPRRDWIENGISAAGRNDIIGGEVIVEPKENRQITAVEAFEVVFAFHFKQYIERKKFTGSGNMFVRKAVFNDVGGFRGGVSEDVDWSHRAINSGYKILYDSTIVVGHPARRTWQELKRKFERISLEMYTLQREKPLGKLIWFLKSFIVLMSPFLHIAKIITHRGSLSLSNKVGAAKVLFAVRIYRFTEMNRLLLRDIAGRS